MKTALLKRTKMLLAALVLAPLMLCVPALTGTALAAPTTTVTARTGLGGVNITGWCRKNYNSSAFNGVVVANNVYGWRCQYGSDYGTRLNVDMNAACAFTYPGRPGSARYSNYNDPYSWYCV